MKLKILPLLFTIILLSLTQNIYSQFGKNIVQYREFDWKYIETKHFDVFFNKGSKYLAEFAAMSAEKALQSVQNTLNYRINKRIRLIIFDTHNEFQQTNVISQFMTEGIGGVTELAKNRMVVPFQGSYSQFNHVIHHELVHAVMNDMFYGGTFQTALRSGNLGKVPIWISEGLAEFESSGGYNIETDMFMRDVSLNEKLRDLDKMNNYYAYRGGQAFFWYVAEKYGRERVGDLINRLRVQRDLKQAFKSAFNMDIEEFSEEFKNDLKKFYWPDIAKYEGPRDFSERITNSEKEENFYNSSPTISPDGRKMAYISAPGGMFSIMLRDLDDKKEEPKKLVSSFRTQDFEDLNILTPGISWNPDGTKIAVSAKAGGEDAIFLVDIETGDYEKMKFGLRSITSVNWSPDGKMLAFIGSANGQSDIYTYNMSTKNLINITDDVFSDFHPVWTPDSKQIFFISDRSDNITGGISSAGFNMWNYDFDNVDIYSIQIEDKTIDRITFTPEFNKTSLSVSSKGNDILFTADNNGILNIYRLNLESNRLTPITNSLTGITQLSLSPDESKLLFSTQINGAYDIYMMRYPFEKKLEVDTLPITKFRESAIAKQNIIQELKQDDTISGDGDFTEIEHKVYGNFEVEFSRQQVIKPNVDAETKTVDDYLESTHDVEDTVYNFSERDYKITFSPDFISGNPGYSTFWGFQGITQLLFSDVLGDHKIFVQANLLIDLRNSTFYTAYLYQPEVIDYMIAASHQAAFIYYGYNEETGEDSLYRFRNYGAELTASYPLDLFNRIEWGLSWKNVSKENVLKANEPSISRILFIPQGRYVHDDVLYSYFGPIRGSRYYMGFMGTPKLSNDGVGFLTVNGDFRNYFQISDMTSIAIRGAFGASMGPNPQNFYLGGTDYWINSWFSYDRMPFNEPEDFAFINSSIIMPLRGYGVGDISGNRYFLTNVEFRFPFIGWLFATPIPIAQAFMGAVFFDIGGAWSGDLTSFKSTTIDDKERKIPKNLLMSTGVGLRTYLLGIPLKIDIAWANLYHKWSEPKYLFSLGYDF
ncbi:peptidase MA family metallohydrolase [Bacteroidota bacterium]